MDKIRSRRRDTLPAPILEALAATDIGATAVARLVIDGLLEMTDDRVALAAATALVRRSLCGYAPIWHIAQAIESAEPVGALARIRRELDHAVSESVARAAAWVMERGGPVVAAPSSAIVAQVLSTVGGGGDAASAVAGLAGADAIGPTAILNIKGTRAIAQRVPTLVVSTSLKLVPEDVFVGLGAPSFERIPLGAFAGVVLDGELLSPREVALRATMVAHDGF